MKTSLTETSKFLSYVLRHQPQAIGTNSFLTVRKIQIEMLHPCRKANF